MKKFENPALDAKIADFLKSDKTISASEFGSAAISIGFVGVVEGYGYADVVGPGTSVRSKEQGDQIVDGIVIAKIGEPSKAFFLGFEGGARQVAMGALQQNPASSFKFDDGTEISATKMVGTDWAKLVNATVELVDTYTDTAKPITRTRTENGKQVQDSRPSRVYKFEVRANYN